MEHLLTDDSGVNHVEVGPFKIQIDYSLAVPASEIKDRIFAACRQTHPDFIEVDEQGQRIVLSEPDPKADSPDTQTAQTS